MRHIRGDGRRLRAFVLLMRYSGLRIGHTATCAGGSPTREEIAAVHAEDRRARESLRLISLAMAALRELSEPEPERHVIVGREASRAELATGWGERDTVLISRRPFRPEDISRAKQAIAANHREAVYLPGEMQIWSRRVAAIKVVPDPKKGS